MKIHDSQESTQIMVQPSFVTFNSSTFDAKKMDNVVGRTSTCYDNIINGWVFRAMGPMIISIF